MNQLSKQQVLDLAHQAYLEPVYPDPRFPPSLYYRFLRLLAQAQRCRLAVELGVCGGGASLHLCQSAEIVIGVDVTNEYPENIKHIQARFPHFTFLMADSVGIADTIFAQYGYIDLLFIDTTHTYGQTMAEFETYRPYVTPGGLVCLDDLYREGMDLAWGKMPEPKIRLDHLHVGGSPTDGGFGVVLL